MLLAQVVSFGRKPQEIVLSTMFYQFFVHFKGINDAPRFFVIPINNVLEEIPSKMRRVLISLLTQLAENFPLLLV
jgi:hypothetical protein